MAALAAASAVGVAGAAAAGAGSGLVVMYRAYESAALRTPIITKAATSGVAYFLGDALAQLRVGSGSAKQRFDLRRAARSTLAGFVSHGPQLHYWCLFLDAQVRLGSAAATLVAKIVLDQTVFSLYLNGVYCALVEALKGAPPAAVWRRVRAAALPSLVSSWRFWPWVHALTYSVVPLHLRVLWVDCVEVVWVSILATCTSKAASDDEGCLLGQGTCNLSLEGSEEESEEGSEAAGPEAARSGGEGSSASVVGVLGGGLLGAVVPVAVAVPLAEDLPGGDAGDGSGERSAAETAVSRDGVTT